MPSLAKAWRLTLLVGAAALVAGCQHRIAAPVEVSEPARVYVIDYGRHASLALPAGERRLVEWSWGDWDFFAKERTGLGSGLRALFASRGSTLARRELEASPRAAAIGAQEVHGLTVERARAAALLASLEERWVRGQAHAVRHGDGRVFVPDPARYSLGNNSVHELNRWLRTLGVDVRGSGVTARYRLRPVTEAPAG